MSKELENPPVNAEKRAAPTTARPQDIASPPINGLSSSPTGPTGWSRLKEWNDRFETLTGLESRGIARVPVVERETATLSSYINIALLWISANLTANCITLAMLGPLVFNLSFTDSALCAIFGALIGNIGPAYISTWGPRSGHRTMIVARYFMGYWPSRLTSILSLLIMLGYGTINCIITGQLLSAVNGRGLSLVPGIIIVSAITLVIAVFGIKAFHSYERFAWFPQVLVLFVLIGSAGPHFNTSSSSVGDPATVRGHRLSYLSLCMSSPIAWSACAADFFVYYPPTAPKKFVALGTYVGTVVAFCFGYLIGIGLASGVSDNGAWATAYDSSQGALILAGFSGLNSFGSFCGTVLALGIIADNIAATYAAALVLQMVDQRVSLVPRWLLSVGIVVVYTACALGGRNYLFDIFQNFIAIMGYWTAFFFCICLEEHILFRSARHKRSETRQSPNDDEGLDDGYDWEAWDDARVVPVGLAALAAFLIGWAGAVVSMDQAWYVGPIARMVGKDGVDLGLWVGAGFTSIVFPPLRFLELRFIGR